MKHKPPPHAAGSPGPGWRAHAVAPEQAGLTLEELLRGPLSLSGRMLQRLTRARGLRVNGRPGHLKRKLRAGDRVEIRAAAPGTPSLPPVEMELAVIHEDDDLLVVNKPAGLLVHPTRAQHTRTLAHGVAAHLVGGGAVHPVHRIDRGTSGLVVFAKSPTAHAALDRDLREHRLHRRYRAVVEGEVHGEEGAVEAPVGGHPTRPELRGVRPEGSPATTRWRVSERLRGATLLEVELESGRTHQIRVHLAHAGHPVYGDRDYGAVESFSRPALHAASLSLPHPSSGEVLELHAPLPDDLRQLIRALGGGP